MWSLIHDSKRAVFNERCEDYKKTEQTEHVHVYSTLHIAGPPTQHTRLKYYIHLNAIMGTVVIVAQQTQKRFICECTDCNCNATVDAPNTICGDCKRRCMGDDSSAAGLKWNTSRVVYESRNQAGRGSGAQ